MAELVDDEGRDREPEVERDDVLDVNAGGDKRPREEVSVWPGQLSTGSDGVDQDELDDATGNDVSTG
ncbi:hypothetical protein RISK_005759 [Rhodopirellula islandica]|uniref:Uncharacterized protein n=1 Tax=Rhodopirellula islandica TaxID=595434 RepID=A0A0J1B7Z8_RHOIS|nr:hypothetical protein [Rhodopirellula islandica]KLU02693.1 hypothetical protein RISK_005759 [Rhodopirellula islandica]